MLMLCPYFLSTHTQTDQEEAELREEIEELEQHLARQLELELKQLQEAIEEEEEGDFLEEEDFLADEEEEREEEEEDSNHTGLQVIDQASKLSVDCFLLCRAGSNEGFCLSSHRPIASHKLLWHKP